MKVTLQYVCDARGKAHAVILPLTEWKQLLSKLKKYEQVLKLEADLKEAFDEISRLSKTNKRKLTLNNFLQKI